MKRKLLLSICAAGLLFVVGCGPKIYKTDDFSAVTASHKTVAILPTVVAIQLRPNELKKTTPEQIKQQEEATGNSIQDQMYAWFLKRKGKYKYTVEFQDISKTNALLKKAGVTAATIGEKTKEELSQLLGVDAVISSRADMKKPMSEEAAVAVGLIAGAWGSTNTVKTSITIHEGKKGDLVWKYDYDASGSVGSSTDKLVDALMRNASKNFPYGGR